MKKLLFGKRAIVFYAGFIMLALSAHLYATNSEPYKYLVSYVENSKDLNNEVGRIKDIDLAFMRYKVSYSENSGKARFKVYVGGEKNDLTLYAKLIKENNVWQVSSLEKKVGVVFWDDLLVRH